MHTLVDSVLGPITISPPCVLGPGQMCVVSTTAMITDSIKNTATWTAVTDAILPCPAAGGVHADRHQHGHVDGHGHPRDADVDAHQHADEYADEHADEYADGERRRTRRPNTPTNTPTATPTNTPTETRRPTRRRHTDGDADADTPTITPTTTPTSNATATNTPVPEGGTCDETTDCEQALTCIDSVCTANVAPAPAASGGGLAIMLGMLIMIGSLALLRLRRESE